MNTAGKSSPRLSILWVCGSPVVGGAERVTLQLSTLLADRGHRIEALCPPHSALSDTLRRGNLPTRSAPLGRELDPRAVLAIRRGMRTTSPDILLVTSSSEWIAACLASTGVADARLVLVRHMALPLRFPIRSLAGYRADAIIAVSQAVRASLLSGSGIPPNRIHVILNPVRFTVRPQLPTASERIRARARLSLPPSGHWVGFFGGHRREKGLADALHAVHIANQQLGETHLLIGGRRARDADAAGLAIGALAGRVHDLGETDHVLDALTAVDVVVMPTHSRLSEALPATLIEGMACGTPVIGYATGGIPEVIGTDGVTGRLARVDNLEDFTRLVIETLAQPECTQRMAAAGLARVQQLFDPQHAADRYEELFERLRWGSARPVA